MRKVGGNYVLSVSIPGLRCTSIDAVLLAGFWRFVSEELKDKPACRLAVDVDVEESARFVGRGHVSVRSRVWRLVEQRRGCCS